MQLADGRVAGEAGPVVIGPDEGREGLEGPLRAGSPTPASSLDPLGAETRMRVVAGPAGVRVARQTPPVRRARTGRAAPASRGRR